MKCPLFVMGNIANPGILDDEVEDCYKEECAWWNKVLAECVVLSILEELRLLVGAAGMIADKMPTPPTIKK